jgi:hypothetical protein
MDRMISRASSSAFCKGTSSGDLWSAPERTLEGPLSDRQASPAYKDLEEQIGQWGIVSFAEASTSVPFVRAATGALVIAQAIRLAPFSRLHDFFRCSSVRPRWRLWQISWIGQA